MPTPFGFLFILSFLGWPLFTYEIFRHYLRVSPKFAGPAVALSVIFEFVVLAILDAAIGGQGSQTWLPIILAAGWLWTPFVFWLLFRLRRRRHHGDTKA